MTVQTKKLTTAAVCTALAVMMCAATAYLPLSFMPLYLAAFCIFLACKRGSLAYGILCAVASVGLMFLMSGLTVKWLMFVLVFAPYGIMCVFIEKLNYAKVRPGVLRAAAVIAYYGITIGIVLLIADNVLTVNMDISLPEWVNMWGGYILFDLVAVLILVPLDFIFCVLSAAVLKKIPMRLGKKELLEKKKETEQADEKPKAPEVDIFGYEIKKNDEKSDNND